MVQLDSVLKKNDRIEIEIEDIGSEGEGIGRYQGYTLFVKDTVMGDRALVQVTKTGTLRLPFRYRIQPMGRTLTNTLGQIVNSIDL